MTPDSPRDPPTNFTKAQKSAIRESLVLYFDSGSETGYLRFCPLSTPVFPHGLSIGVKVSAKHQEDVEAVKDKVADFLVESLESILSREDDNEDEVP